MFQFKPRGVICLVMLAAVSMLPLASGRRMHLNADSALEFEHSRSSDVVSKEAVKTKNSIDEMSLSAETLESRGGPKKIDVAMKILIRECVGERAEDWMDLQRRLGFPSEKPENVTTPMELVSTLYEMDDMIQARAESRSALQSVIHPAWASTNVKQWKEEQKKATEDLEKWGFDYDQAWDRCAKGATNDAYKCMVDAAEGDSLKQKVRRRVDLKDFVMQLRARRYFWQEKEEYESHVWDEIKQIDQELKAAGYDRKNIKKSCRKALSDEVASVKSRILNELSAGQKDEEGDCHEKTDQMCPEGTYATNARRWDKVKGATVMGTAFLVAKFTFLPLGTAIGTALAGPAGATAGFLAGNALVAPIAIAAGYWASRGPLECACFPRECEYDTRLDVCRLNITGESKNPFSTQLPMSGMKCALKYKSQDECGIQQCSLKDYGFGALGDTEVFGIIGHHGGKDLYNCLSTSPSQYDSLAGVHVLPNGQNNSIAERNKIFTLALKPSSDGSNASNTSGN